MRFVLCALVMVAGSTVSIQAQQWTPPPADLVERARRILQAVPIIDGHNDIPSKLLESAGGDPDKADLSKPQPQFHTDFARLRQGGVGAQFWSAYVENDSIPAGAALRQGIREVDMALRFTRRYPDVLELARTAADIERIEKQGKIASLIGLEGGHGIENQLSALRAYYELGVRYMTLTHNTTLSWADAAQTSNGTTASPNSARPWCANEPDGHVRRPQPCFRRSDDGCAARVRSAGHLLALIGQAVARPPTQRA